MTDEWQAHVRRGQLRMLDSRNTLTRFCAAHLPNGTHCSGSYRSGKEPTLTCADHRDLEPAPTALDFDPAADRSVFRSGVFRPFACPGCGDQIRFGELVVQPGAARPLRHPGCA